MNPILFGTHKFISIASIVMLILGTLQLLNPIQADTRMTILYVFSFVAIISTLSSGGLLRFDKFGIPSIVLIHKISSIPIILLGGLTLHFTSTTN